MSRILLLIDFHLPVKFLSGIEYRNRRNLARRDYKPRRNRCSQRERKGGCRWPDMAGVESPPTTGHTDIPPRM
jgi:hypothetical protein